MTEAYNLIQELRPGQDFQGCLNILVWELGDLAKAIQYAKWHPDLADGYRGEAKLALAAILVQVEALCGMYDWSPEQIRELGLDQIRERIEEMKRKEGRFSYYTGGEKHE